MRIVIDYEYKLFFSSRRSSRIEPREMRERAKMGLMFYPCPTFCALSHLSRFDSRRSPRREERDYSQSTLQSFFRITVPECIVSLRSIQMDAARWRGGNLQVKQYCMGICRWMGSHFHNWTEYNEVTFLVELLKWGRKFSRFLR